MKRLLNLFVILLLVASPAGFLRAASSASYVIDPADDSVSSGKTISSPSYSLSGSLDPIGGRSVSASFALESGGSGAFGCGDGFVDPGEECESGDLDGGSCVREGFASGTIACGSDCSYNTSGCATRRGGGGGGGGGSSAGASYVFSFGQGSPVSGDVSFGASETLFGDRPSGSTVTIDGSSSGVSYPSSTTWSATVALSAGVNDLALVVVSSSGQVLETARLSLIRRAVGDVNGDNVVDDYDLSLIVRIWNSASASADFNGDGIVDDYDFSMLVSRWNRLS